MYRICAALSAAVLMPVLLHAGEPGPLARKGIVPADTKVVLLPVVVRPDVDLPEAPCQTLCRRAAKAPFWRHGFQVVDGSTTAEAMTRLGICLADPDRWNKDSYKAIGDELGARLVLALQIISAKKQGQGAFVETTNRMVATVEMRLYDCQDGCYVFDQFLVGKKNSTLWGAATTGDLLMIATASLVDQGQISAPQARQIKAAALGIRDGSQQLLVGYPIVNEDDPPEETPPAPPAPAEGTTAETTPTGDQPATPGGTP